MHFSGVSQWTEREREGGREGREGREGGREAASQLASSIKHKNLLH